MAKVSGAYKSLVRGVSQQVPEERLPGQHTEQVNMLSDPVRGLVRRPGTVNICEGGGGVASGVNVADWQTDLSTHFASRDIVLDTREFTVHTRRPGLTGPAVPVVMLERGGALDGESIPTSLTPGAAALLNAGVVGHAVVGRFLLLAHTSTIAYVADPQWDNAANNRIAVAHVRTGNYSRTYTLRLKVTGGTELLASYTTPTASYQGVLDTSDIPADATDYQKQVNDRVNAYQAAVTQWLGTAAAAIQPQAVAQALVAAANAAGFGAALGTPVTRSGSVLNLSAVGAVTIETLRADDGGDGSSLRLTWKTVEDAAFLPPLGVVGQVMRVQPKDDGEVYYLKATSTATGLQPVVWQEAAGVSGVISSPFCVAVLHNDVLYIAENATALQAQLDTAAASITVPPIAERNTGDEDSNALPYFAGRAITYIGVFQDRLALASGPVMNFSRIGDYFNFFKATVLTSKDDDPVEVYSTGSENDVIRHGVFFDRNLVLFGDKQQYPLSGKVPLTPATATMIQSSSHKDATVVRPISQGDLVFYSKVDDQSVNVYQIAVGNVDDTTNSTEVTQQLDTYITGTPLDMLGLSMPNTVVIRTDAAPHSLFILRYLDTLSQERVLESWSRWDFSPALGPIVGIGAHKDRLRITYARSNAAGTSLYLAVDEAFMVPGQQLRPHLDSLRPEPVAAASPAWHAMWCAFGSSPGAAQKWQGIRSNDSAQLFAEVGTGPGCWAGVPFDAYATLTSPYPRDRSDAVISTGRTTVAQLVISYANTGALDVFIDSPYEQASALRFVGNVIGSDTNRVGEISLQRGVQSAVIGREVRDYSASIRAIDWYPMSVTAIDWVGQYFNNTRRV